MFSMLTALQCSSMVSMNMCISIRQCIVNGINRNSDNARRRGNEIQIQVYLFMVRISFRLINNSVNYADETTKIGNLRRRAYLNCIKYSTPMH